MWVEEFGLENIRCFNSETKLKFTNVSNEPVKWVTFLGENGGGKSTALQALGMLMAGPEGAQILLPRPTGWLRDESRHGRVFTRIHKDVNDPGVHGSEKKRTSFAYSYAITGNRKLTFNNKVYTEPAITFARQKILSWLRENASPSKGTGWFAAGYGAFRRLTRSSQIIVPSLEPQARYTNFITQFDEAEPLSVFERWMVYLDYRIAKGTDKVAERQRELATAAINRVLLNGAMFDSVTPEGRILFKIGGQLVPTISLSDGYRSILALAGDLIWRLILSFPESSDPLQEKGVVLIDELDIHLHPLWQRQIASLLRNLFPNLQFFVATHSPLIAAGAGDDALTLRFDYKDGAAQVKKIENISAMSVDRILQSSAFGLVSPFSPQTQEKIERFELLERKKPRTTAEKFEYNQLFAFMENARPLGGLPKPGSLDEKIEAYLEKTLI